MSAQSWNWCSRGTAAPCSVEGEDVQAAKESGRRAPSFDCWDWCSGVRWGSRRGGIRFGYFLIVLGLFWLGGAMGWLQAGIIVPLTMVAIGLWLAVLSRIRWKRKT